jgi:hypothetical protein
MKWKDVKEGDIIYSGDWYAVFLKIKIERNKVTMDYFSSEGWQKRVIFSTTEEMNCMYTILQK